MAIEVAHAIEKVKAVQAELEQSRRERGTKAKEGPQDDAALLSPTVRRQLIRGHNAAQAASKQVRKLSSISDVLSHHYRLHERCRNLHVFTFLVELHECGATKE